MPQPYRKPVARLLTLGKPRLGGSKWRNYEALGLRARHVPELVQMALDDDLHRGDPESSGVWAPLHAWRALGQLGAENAAEPLLPLLDLATDDDWAQEDLPEVFGMLGPAALPGLRDFLADTGHDEWARITAGESLVKIAQRFPEGREQAVAALTGQLRCFAGQDRLFNAFLVLALCDLEAVESAAVIEQAFAAGAVDLFLLGDWEEAQIRLGLIQERVTPQPNFLEIELGLSSAPRQIAGKPAPHKADKKKKARRKQARASRKRSRKR